MDTKHLKAYGPKARRQFIDAVQQRAAYLGIYEHEIADAIQDSTSSSGSVVVEGRVFTRQQATMRTKLIERMQQRGYEMFCREMAYTWFNRLAAIRYLELHDYLGHGYRVLSNANDSGGEPEIISAASEVAEQLGLDKATVVDLQLAGNQDEELYRLLLLAQVKQLSTMMPQVFGLGVDDIDEAMELLLPDNLTKTDSIIKDLINDVPEQDWQNIEVIGWLYQFYISEKKDEVIGKVVKSEDIPAATQLFTPNWIVKYMVQNSLGAQWLATYPDSPLKAEMEYYIEPAEQTDEVNAQLKAITPESLNPETLTLIDPASGSGHILVEAYDLFKAIYLERGYRQRDIPKLVLEKNLRKY